MAYTTLISTGEVAAHLDDPAWVLVDCRFQLDDPAAGRAGYLAGHLPSAVYAHLDEDLSGPVIPGQTGRHPLPVVATFAATLGAWGISADNQVIAYDDFHGVYAGRLWWMLRWVGHDAVAVLDGDFRTWVQEGRPVATGAVQRTPTTFVPHPRPDLHASVDEVLTTIDNGAYRLFDVRDEKRYRGEPNPLDPVSGHIPGAHSAWYGHNLGADGKFRSPEQLRTHYSALLGDTPPEECIFYCGSGVSVHHSLLALEHAGLGRGARPFIGSWSQWIADPARPVRTGEQP
jgi:thiosulfate/3-mercaptopyruvate sulfurtransferase